MSIHDDFGNRMKAYEKNAKNTLMKRTPVAIRIDGRAFHTFTKGLIKPFDLILTETMQQTMKYLCENIQGCVFGYTQSDEITLILIDYQTLTTSAWFDNEVQKICSISASMATMIFNKIFMEKANDFIDNYYESWNHSNEADRYVETLCEAMSKGAMFDSRCFNIPKEEVCNLIYWRQLDAIKNSIQMIGRKYFTEKELYKKNCNMIKEMLLNKDIYFETFPINLQRGTSCIKIDNKWVLDEKMPILKNKDREYVEKYIIIGEC